MKKHADEALVIVAWALLIIAFLLLCCCQRSVVYSQAGTEVSIDRKFLHTVDSDGQYKRSTDKQARQCVRLMERGGRN